MKNKPHWQFCCICFLFILLVSNANAVSFQSVKTETDADADGTIDEIIFTFYDNCRPIELRVDNNADGIVDSISYTTYDTGKYTTIVRHDLNADGTIDQIQYFWEENNASEKRSITEEDLDGNGTIDSFTCYVYIDESSSAILRTYEGIGSYAGGGTLMRVKYITKNANGDSVKEELDKDADSLIDEITYISYGENCLPVLNETDLENDGEIDQVTQLTYDSKCRPLRTEVDSDLVVYGMHFLSNVIVAMDYTDDANGFPIKIETHSTATETAMGQTVTQQSTIIQYMTYEYADGDCGPSTLCPSCTSIGSDSDSDGLTDSVEAASCTNPLDSDTDDDGIPDGVEDSNHNGVLDSGETNPCSLDTDGDGIQDGTESGYTLAMVGPDTNANIFTYDADPLTTTNPLLIDTDDDGFSDGLEDANKNGRLDAGESDPLKVNISLQPTLVPVIELLLLNSK